MKAFRGIHRLPGGDHRRGRLGLLRGGGLGEGGGREEAPPRYDDRRATFGISERRESTISPPDLTTEFVEMCTDRPLRLVATEEYDPGNLFRVNRNIPPA